MGKKENGCGYVTRYKIGGAIYEVETSFSGTETLNNKIIRLMLSEKLNQKGLTIRKKHGIILIYTLYCRAMKRRIYIMNKPDINAILCGAGIFFVTPYPCL